MNEFLALAQKAARESADIVRSYYGNAAVTNKPDQSPVTEADTAVHHHLLSVLGQTGIQILSEEDAEETTLPYPDLLWIIDPIDGTKGFVHGTGDFAIMIALLERGQPVLGVVHMPVSDTQYVALRGSGAHMVREGVTTPLEVSGRTQPMLHMVQSLNHSMPYMDAVAEALGVTDVIRVGSIGVKVGVVAEARADFFLTLGDLGEWDVCAPHIILEEAGGCVTDRNGATLMYGNEGGRIRNGVIFSNTACHTDVVDALARVVPPPLV